MANGLQAVAKSISLGSIHPSSYQRREYINTGFIDSNPFSFGENNIATGISEGYNYNTYVYSIVHRIATNASNVPLKVMQYDRGKDEASEIFEGEFYDLVQKPNDQATRKTFIYEAITFQLLTGNRFQSKQTAVGLKGIHAVHNLFPQAMDIDMSETPYGYKPLSYKYQYNSKEYPFKLDEISHLKKFNPDMRSARNGLGLSPLQAAYRTLTTSNEIMTAEASTISNKGMTGMLTSKADRPLTTEEKQWADEAVRKRIGGASKYGSIGVTSGDMRFVSFSLSPQDLQLLESGIFKLRDLAAIYGVSSRTFNDVQGGTYNNSKEDDKKMYTNGVLPPLELEVEQFNNDIAKAFNDDQFAYYIEIDKASIESLQADQVAQSTKSKNQSEVISKAISGIKTGDWTREAAIEQIIFTLAVDEEVAERLVGQPVKQEDDGQSADT